MQTTTTTAAKTKTAKKVGAQATLDTLGLLVDSRPATFADLTPVQINAAIEGVKFTVKLSARQQTTGIIQDLIQDALLDILDNKYIWDSTKGSFYLCIKMRVKELLRKGTAKTSYQREGTSYSGAEGSDGEEMEFNYATDLPSPAAILEAKQVPNPTEKFNERELEYIKFVELVAEYKRRKKFNTKHKIKEELEVFTSKDIATYMNFPSDGAFRVWVSKFKKRHGINEEITNEVSASALRKRAAKVRKEAENDNE